MSKWEVSATFMIAIAVQIDKNEMLRWVDGQVPARTVEREILKRGTIIEHELQSVDYMELDGDDDGQGEDHGS